MVGGASSRPYWWRAGRRGPRCKTGTPLWLWKPIGPGHAFAVGDDVGDDRAPKPPHAPLFAFLLEQAGFFDAADPIGVAVIIAHVIKGSLGDEAQFALIRPRTNFVPQYSQNP